MKAKEKQTDRQKSNTEAEEVTNSVTRCRGVKADDGEKGCPQEAWAVASNLQDVVSVKPG